MDVPMAAFQSHMVAVPTAWTTAHDAVATFTAFIVTLVDLERERDTHRRDTEADDERLVIGHPGAELLERG